MDPRPRANLGSSRGRDVGCEAEFPRPGGRRRTAANTARGGRIAEIPHGLARPWRLREMEALGARTGRRLTAAASAGPSKGSSPRSNGSPGSRPWRGAGTSC